MASRLLTLLMVVTVLGGVWQVGSVGRILAKAWLAQQLLERAWQRTLEGERHVRPWPWADTWPMAELLVPRLGIRQIILSGDSGRVLAFAPGYSEASAEPGTRGISVISGHRDTSFRFLKELQSGDTIELRNPTERFIYTVSERAVVDQRYFQINPQLDETEMTEAHLMLVTCYPFDALKPGGDERYLVLARIKSH